MVGNTGSPMLPIGCCTMYAVALDLWSWGNGVQALQPMQNTRDGGMYIYSQCWGERGRLDGLAWLVSSEPMRDHLKKEVCVT